MAGDDPLDADPEPDPPERQPRKPCETRRTERTAVVRENGARQPIGPEDPLEDLTSVRVLGGGKGIARQDVAAEVVDDGQRIAVPVIAEEELTFVIDGHQI